MTEWRVTQHNTPIGNYLRTYLGETEQITGEHKQVASGVGLGTDWQYDTNTNDRRLKSITHTKGKNFYYTRNAEDIITNIHETSNVANATTQDATYTYDNNDRLTQSVNSYINNPYYTNYTWTYTLDGVNNITDVLTSSGGSSDKHYTVNNLNQIDWSSYSYFTYDANGNTTADKQLRVYEWDAENRLTKISPKPGFSGNTTTIQYDGLGRFTKITTTNGGERRFLWCGDELCQSRNSSDFVQKHFYDEGFHTLELNHESVYYIKDHLGSIHNSIGINTQFVYSSFYYNPYGLFYSGSQTGTNLDEFRYAGMFYLPESELYFTRYRAYDPKTGRWLSRDPIAEVGGVNLYGYVEGNPVNFNDPLGLIAPAVGLALPAVGQAIVDAATVLIGTAIIADEIGDYSPWSPDPEVNKQFIRDRDRVKEKDVKPPPYKNPKKPECDEIRDRIKHIEEAMQARDHLTNTWYGGVWNSGHKKRQSILQKELDRLNSRLKRECECQ